ncbi:MAG: Gldg family protein [Candidatus Pseudobacter hemicellulosilyticus]|uniref:Gldg family protein n=1 Tax=Candidatus Pseudobacter hemicellulosilyticus TaxID=3121375 RepID=A0AAJ5WR58_9BACT|nr:MAG: Gldg family protein [Pseudobacter sp.]
MKPIYKIARTELKQLFFSPIAWLILVIFTFQSAMVFTDIFDGLVRRQVIGWKLYMPTISSFAGMQGAFTIIQQYLYLYIPLLTMGVMSREFSSGSIKLLYSSPLTSRQIVFGKYLALVIYSGVLTAILAVFGGFAAATIKEADIPFILTGLLGLFLLTCAYAAVGLFMSSLTSYTVVSAMGTLGIFAVLSYVKGIGQEVEFVRDITYWLAISGRSDTFISGMITSEDLLYFVIVISLFLGFTIIKMQGARQRRSWLVSSGRYAMVFGIAMLLGYFSSQPKLMTYYDATATKVNTLTKGSQEVLKHLDEELTITTYTNMLDENHWIALPASYKWDVDRFKQYIRFKPEIKLKYTYYYEKTDNKQLEKQFPTLNSEQLVDTMVKLYDWKFDIIPYKDIRNQVDLAPERFHFVRHLKTASGKEAFLRVYDDMMRLPSETEITAAFKRLVMDKLPTVGFLSGHGERKSDAEEDRGYNMFAQEKSFRYSFINQGFDFEDITLDKEIPDYIRVLLIAEVRKPLTPEEMTRLNNYIDRGGNCIIAGEPGRLEFMNPIVEKLGVRFEPGMLVKPDKKFQSNLLLLKPTKAAEDVAFHFKNIRTREQLLPMPTASPLSFSTDKGFSVTTLFTSDSSGSWVEKETTNFIDDTVVYNPKAGEVEQPYPVALALSRKIKDKEQKIIVTGDADFLSNGELMMSRKDVSPANFNFISGAFFWLTDGELPADMRRPPTPDKELRLNKTSWAISKAFLKWGLPIGLMLAGLYIWIRRKRR